MAIQANLPITHARLTAGRWWRRAAAWTAVTSVAFLFVFHLGGGWYFSSMIEERALSAAARRAELAHSYHVQVLTVDGDTVALRRPGDTRLPRSGTFGLVWDGGWGTVSDILETRDDDTVVRRFELRGGTPVRAGMLASLDPRTFQGDPQAVGVPFQDVTFQGPLGQYPAWYVAGPRSTWMIFVHGNGMTRLDCLRMLPTAVAAGTPVLMPTYRGDEGAPQDPEGRLTYGKNEWRDLEAAVQYALDHGAQSIVLEGVSMGGAVSMAFMLESPLASRVLGVVLDSPVLDFQRAVEFQARREGIPLIGTGLPHTLVSTAEWLARLRFGVDWDYTDYLERAGQLRTPILLIHGTADEKAPFDASADLARLHPDLVRDFYLVEGAGHVEAWNADPQEYARRLTQFLRDVGALS